MPFGYHARDQVGIAVDQIFENEEGTGGVVRLERIQNDGNVAVFIAGIKGQINDLFFPLAKKMPVVLFNEGKFVKNLAYFLSDIG